MFRGSLIDSQAQAFYDRVIADGGVVPTGLIGVSATFKAVKAIYGVTDITAAISVFYDAHYLGYKLGTGTGTTLGQACTKLYSACGASGDCVQATLASQPLLLAHNGTSSDNYWYSPRITGNFVSSPNATVNQISGNIEIIVRYQSNTSGIVQTLLMKGNGSSYNYAVDISNTNNLRFIFGGFEVITSSVTVNPLTLQYYKFTRNSTTGSVQFFTSSDGVTYTQLGTTQSSTVGNLPTNTVQLVIGDNTAFTGNASQGNIYRVTIANSIGGTPVVDFNPTSYNASTSQTQWTSTTGEVWTINTGTATTGYKGILVDRTIVQSDGVDDNLTDSSFTSTQAYSEYIAHRRLGTGNLVSKATGNSLSNNATNFILNNGVALNFANTSLLSQLITTRNNGASSGQAINNGTETTGNAGTNNGTTLVIGGGNFGVNTYIQSILNDGSTVRTAIYNFIKTLNNNAF